MSEGLAHTTVLLDEAVEALRINTGGVYVDGTFGRGGHSKRILEQLGEDGKLIALDKDPAAVAVGREWQDGRFQIIHSGFIHLQQVIEDMGKKK